MSNESTQIIKQKFIESYENLWQAIGIGVDEEGRDAIYLYVEKPNYAKAERIYPKIFEGIKVFIKKVGKLRTLIKI